MKILFYTQDTQSGSLSTISANRLCRNCGCKTVGQDLERYPDRQDRKYLILTLMTFSPEVKLQKHKDSSPVSSRKFSESVLSQHTAKAGRNYSILVFKAFCLFPSVSCIVFVGFACSQHLHCISSFFSCNSG